MSLIPPLLPLFPLPNVVLFPHMPLPLHIFEPRYRQMTLDAWNGDRLIGMVLLQPGWEEDYYGHPPIYAIGCAGHIERCDPLSDGRFNIVLKGRSRFRVTEEQAGEPYRVGAVQMLSDGLEDDFALTGARRRVMSCIAQAVDGPLTPVLQQELPHEMFVNALSQTLTLAPLERQSLLDCDSILARYTRLAEILDFRLLEHTYCGGDGTVH